MQNKAIAFPKAYAFAYTNSALFLAGLCATFAWSPYEQPYMLFLSLNVFLVRLWFADTRQQAFTLAWVWGFGFYVGNVFWIGNSFLVDAARFAWLMPAAVLGFPACLAVYPALLGYALGCVKRFCGPTSFVLFFVVLWGLLEWTQGHLFTGFPWNLSAYIWAPYLPIAQGASVLGSYGLGLLTVFLFSLPALFLLKKLSKSRLLWSSGLFFSCFLALFVLGKARLWHNPVQFNDKVYLRLVQPFIPQKEKGNALYTFAHFSSLAQQTRRPSQHPITHVIWPESAIPWAMSPETLEDFPNLRLEAPWHLLTGAIYHDKEGKHWNALLSGLAAHDLTPVYYKSHLVPFGEYIPLRSLLSRFVPDRYLQKITPGHRDFSKGPKGQILQLKDTPPFQSLICYEAIFPTRHTQRRPEWILNITNDGWFGYSPGPYQHFASARMRTVEEGLPMVRAANNGVSAIIDPLGRITQALGLNQQGIVDGFLPKPLPPTLYSMVREGLFWLLLLSLIGCACFAAYRHQEEQDSAPKA